MKYNMSEIMKAAWSLKMDNDILFSECLKEAWKVAKILDKKELLNSLNEIENKINNIFADNNFSHIYSLNEWKKENFHRVYVNRTNGRNNKSCGYVDITKKEIKIDSWKIADIFKNYKIA